MERSGAATAASPAPTPAGIARAKGPHAAGSAREGATEGASGSSRAPKPGRGGSAGESARSGANGVSAANIDAWNRAPDPTIAYLEDERAKETTSKPEFEDRLALATDALRPKTGATPEPAADKTPRPPHSPATFDKGEIGADAAALRAARTRDGGTGAVEPLPVGPVSREVRVASAGKIEAPVEARMKSEDPTITAGADANAIRDVVEAAQSAIRRCYEDELRRDPRLTGRVTIAWTVSEDGTPEDVKVESSTLGDTEAESCMATRVRRLHFPAPRGGAVRVEFPFVFEAAIDERG